MCVCWHWTQTLLLSLSSCMMVESRWRGSGNNSSIQTTPRGLRVYLRCCVTKVLPSGTTGRWSGEGDGWISLWQWEASVGGRALIYAGLAIQTSPGVCTALRTTTLLSTTTRRWRYQHLCLIPAGLECIWTGQVALCPSTASPLGPSATFTHSTAPSVNPCSLGLGWKRMTALLLFAQLRVCKDSTSWIKKCYVKKCWSQMLVIMLSK